MKIAFLGDVALVGRYDLEFQSSAGGRVHQLAQELGKYDLVIANLESPLTDQRRTRVPKSLHVRSSRQSVALLKQLHVGAVTLANNHIHDFGTRGILDTIQTLEQNGIDWYGLNNKSLLMEISGQTLSFSGFCCLSTNGTGYLRRGSTYGVNPLTVERVLDQLERDRNDGALSVLSFHWGLEHTNFPNPEHVSFARELAGNTSVIVHGHHPHVVQGVEAVSSSVLAYSLGNFIFDDCLTLDGKRLIRNSPRNRIGLLLVVEVQDGQIVGFETKGVRDDSGGLQLFDITSQLQRYSHLLTMLPDDGSYSRHRQQEFLAGITEKRGPRNLKWLLDRLNPNSVGSFLLGKLRAVHYRQVAAQLRRYRSS